MSEINTNLHHLQSPRPYLFNYNLLLLLLLLIMMESSLFNRRETPDFYIVFFNIILLSLIGQRFKGKKPKKKKNIPIPRSGAGNRKSKIVFRVSIGLQTCCP